VLKLSPDLLPDFQLAELDDDAPEDLDPAIRESWGQWRARIEENHQASSVSPVDTQARHTVDPRRFDAWCKRVGVVACWDALRAYCLAHKRQSAQAMYGEVHLNSDLAPFDDAEDAGGSPAK